MKKFLLTCAAIAIGAAANAQEVTRVETLKADLNATLKAASQTTSTNFAPRKSVEDGVYYKVQEGGMYLFNNEYCYLFYPAFENFKMTNLSTDKASTVWKINNQVVQGDANNDYVTSIANIVPGSMFYPPTLTAPGKVNYTFGSVNSKQTGLIGTDSIWPLTQYDISQTGHYNGIFTDSKTYAFGTGTENIDGMDAEVTTVREYFNKPLKPFYLTTILFLFNSKVQDPIGDKALTAKIYDLAADGTKGDLIATMKLSKEDWRYEYDATEGYGGGYFVGTNQAVDEFGSAIPMILKNAFVVEVTGFNQDGVDLGLRMTNASAVPFQTYKKSELELVDADGKTYTQTREGENGTYRNVLMLVRGMFDTVAPFTDDFKKGIAPAEGGLVYCTYKEQNYTVFAIKKTMPWISTWQGSEGEDNYTVEGLSDYDWLEMTGNNNDNDNVDNGFMSQITLQAAPLPAGVAGRKAVFFVRSAKGAECALTVIQGDEAQGVGNIEVENSVKNKGTFNLSGQRVNDTYKGIVIENGKKVIK